MTSAIWRITCARLWRWLLHRLLKRQSLSTTTVLFRTTFTRTIKLNLLLKWLLGPNLSQVKLCLKYIIKTWLSRVFSSQWLNNISQGNALSVGLFVCTFSYWKLWLNMVSKPGQTTNLNKDGRIRKRISRSKKMKDMTIKRCQKKINFQNPNGIKREINQIQVCWMRLKVQSEKQPDLQRHDARETSGGKALTLMLKLFAGKKQKSQKRRIERNTVIFERSPTIVYCIILSYKTLPWYQPSSQEMTFRDSLWNIVNEQIQKHQLK